MSLLARTRSFDRTVQGTASGEKQSYDSRERKSKWGANQTLEIYAARDQTETEVTSNQFKISSGDKPNSEPVRYNK